MGIPSFYRWLVGRYPKIVENAIDEGEACAPDMPNPNGEFDNLYLDMNGIIHPCFHPDNELFLPTTFDEVFMAIFEYIDHLFQIVRPRKLLYLALDGVAPRAKMNQQRARRYRVAKDAEIAEIEEERLRREFEHEGKVLIPKQEHSEVSDSNVITPGTVFMQKLSRSLEYYVRLRLNSDPSWKFITVFISDANVPGEGEHKIMSFIRFIRRFPGYDPNTRHCLYGLDADLIMLALSTHEIHFCILREDVLKQDNQEICLSTLVANSSQKELNMFKSRQWFKKFETRTNKKVYRKPYQFLNIWRLREYLELDMKPQSDADIERVVDDFIFICFLSGNDFLPSLPTIEIHECGINILIAVYKKMFKFMGGYLINSGNINKESTAYMNFKGLKIFLMEVGSYEDMIFEKRYILRKRLLKRLQQERENEEHDGNNEFNVMPDNFNCVIGASDHISDSFSKKCNISTSAEVEANSSIQSDALENTNELKRRIKQFLQVKSDLYKSDALDNDKVKLGCPGWRARYYKIKFSAENAKEIDAVRRDIVKKYIEGLCWVLQYYFTGICSWSWYYPFYYGPFASDFKDPFCEVSFTVGRPFKPFDQLMAVLPPRSSHALPKAYKSLMNDDESPIANFFRTDFVVDYDGKRFTWQGVCKLPFIDEKALLGATKGLLKELQADEVERNSMNNDKAFVMESNSLFTIISSLHEVSENHPSENLIFDVFGASGISDLSSHSEGCSAVSKFSSPVLGMEDISCDKSRCITFTNQLRQAHIPRLLDGARIPEKTITAADIVEKMLWHGYHGQFPPALPQRHAREHNTNETLPELDHDTWKCAGVGWNRAGRGKMLKDENKPLNWIDKGNAPNNYGRGQYGPPPFQPTAAPLDIWRQRSVPPPASLSGRFENWRQRSMPMVSSNAREWGQEYRAPPAYTIPAAQYQIQQPMIQRPAAQYRVQQPMIQRPAAQYRVQQPMIQRPAAQYQIQQPMIQRPVAGTYSNRMVERPVNQRPVMSYNGFSMNYRQRPKAPMTSTSVSGREMPPPSRHQRPDISASTMPASNGFEANATDGGRWR